MQQHSFERGPEVSDSDGAHECRSARDTADSEKVRSSLGTRCCCVYTLHKLQEHHG